MQALTQQLLLLHRSPSTSPTLVASSSPSCTSSSSSSLRGPSCWSNSFSSPLSWGSSSSSSSCEQHAERLWRTCGPTGRLNLSSVRPRNVIRAATGDSSATSTIEQPSSTGKDGGGGVGQQQEDDRVKHITTIEQFDEALISAKKKLVVVEYAATHSSNSRKIYPSMVDLSKTLKGVVFLLVLGDESDDTRELCERAGVEKVPHFVFYKHSVKIHEEQGITEEMLEGDVLYYGDNDAPIHQVRNKDDFEVLLNEHASDNKLVVLDIGLKSCGPCAKIYPTFVKLATRMAGNTVFARMHGDENKECVTLLKSMDVKEVPTFLFLRDGKPLGRYVGSGRGELVGEILRHNGVRCT